MSEAAKEATLTNSKSKRNKAIAVAGLCVLACKVPFLLALLGFGGISATASMLNLPPIVQTIGITVGVLGFTAVLGYLIFLVTRRQST